MGTWGQIAFELTKRFPGIDPDLAQGWINESYRQILDYLPWSGLNAQAWLTVNGIYSTGTVAVTEGASAITGAGTTWTSAMNARRFRVLNDPMWYTFTYVSPTSGTLDRVFEGTTAASASYHIFQDVYTLPEDAKYVNRIVHLTGELELKPAIASDLPDSRMGYGTPLYWLHSDDTDDPGFGVLHRIELYPIPEESASYRLFYQKAPVHFDGTNTASYPLPWVSSDLILRGAVASAAEHKGDFNAADRNKARFAEMLVQMSQVEAGRADPVPLQMASRFTSHRRARWQR